VKRDECRFKRLTTLISFQDFTRSKDIILVKRDKSRFKRLTTLPPFQHVTHPKFVQHSTVVITRSLFSTVLWLSPEVCSAQYCGYQDLARLLTNSPTDLAAVHMTCDIKKFKVIFFKKEKNHDFSSNLPFMWRIDLTRCEMTGQDAESLTRVLAPTQHWWTMVSMVIIISKQPA
jgi:hypothetical protein